jgi:hypothetical protein
MKTVTLLAAILVLNAAIAQKNILIKWAPASLAGGKLTLGSEYNFKKKQSVEFFIGLPVPVAKKFDYDNHTSEVQSSALSLFAGYRYYFGNRDVRGVYIEPFVKYLHHKADGILVGELDGESARFDTKTDYSAIGAGVQLGVQFLIAKRVSLDFFLIGPEGNSAKFSSTSTDVASSIPWTFIEAHEAEQNIKDAMKDLPIIGNKIEVDVNQATKTVYTNYHGFVPGFRFGASVGIRL